MSLFDSIVKAFNKGEDKGELQYDIHQKCPKCKKFNLLVEYGYKFCSNGDCDYKETITKEEEENEFYDGII